ncbi:MAG: AAA family ATPase [Deltaproteobacteria bacterium]|nr:AAA family ATPase [Deltaproteobacteria bacterium]
MLIPGFVITAELHSGIRNVVLRAKCKRDGKMVLIKTTPGDYPDLRQIAHLRYEYDLTSEIRHPRIIQPLELIESAGRILIVYEDIDGIPLNEYMTGSDPGIMEKLKIALQLADTLGYLHNEGLIHKNIRPENIIVNSKTSDIKITGFGSSSRLKQESHEGGEDAMLPEGSLSYISPEQTGRMNRSVDYRTDIYSLGIVFYELFTKKLPFYGEDTIELIYGHIAKKPPDPVDIDQHIPEMINHIILACIEKKPEERYQSAFALKKDLQLCYDHILSSDKIPTFTLGKKEFSGQFLLSERLYGREDCVQELVDCFYEVAGNRSALALISGFSGTGKSSVLNELQKPVVEERSIFLRGKFEDTSRNVPYRGFIEAFSDLISQILMNDEQVVSKWRKKLIDFCENDGWAIADFLPDLHDIIGSSGDEHHYAEYDINSFHQMLARFIEMFSSNGHPLVICLDDLQWSDLSSLDLILFLILDNNVHNLLIVGTYRSNEVDNVHPLIQMIRNLKENDGVIRNIELKSLRPEHVLALISDSLMCHQEEAITLSKLIYSKTHGNPFFTGQLLKSIYDDGLLRFDEKKGHWEWDVEEIRAKNISGNVIALMEEKLRKLPDECLYYIQLSSCIGVKFSLEVLALLLHQPRSHVMSVLIHAIHEGLLRSPSFDYRFILEQERQGHSHINLSENQHYLGFVHDRIQQAAYSGISSEKKKECHLMIGRMLLHQYETHSDLKSIYNVEIVGHFNRSLSLITEINDRIMITKMNLKAGIQARESVAIESAANFFSCAIKAMGEYCWQESFKELCYTAHYNFAETLFLRSDFDESENILDTMLQIISDPFQKAQVHLLLMNLRVNQSRLSEAYQLGINALKLLGISVPGPRQSIVMFFLELVKAGFNSHRKLPMSVFSEDQKKILAARIFSDLFWISQKTNRYIRRYLALKSFNMIFKDGLTEFSMVNYLVGAHALWRVTKNIRFFRKMSELSFVNMKDPRFQKSKGQFYALYGYTAAIWYQEPKKCLSYINTAMKSSYESGYLLWETFCSSMMISHMHCAESSLDTHLRRCEESFNFAKKSYFFESKICYRSHYEFIAAMTEVPLTSVPLQPPEYQYSPRQTLIYLQNKIKEHVIFDQIDQAWELFYKNMSHTLHDPEDFPSSVMIEFYFYLGIALIRANSKNIGDKRILRIWVKKSFNNFKVWSILSKDLCGGKYLFLKAEKLRAEKEIDLSLKYYNEIAEWASECDLPLMNAMANEAAGILCIEQNNLKFARSCLIEARFLYDKWGSSAKVKMMDLLWRDLFLQIKIISSSLDNMRDTEENHQSMISNETSDLNTVIKFSHAVSSEIRIGDLLKKITQFILENAGAEKGFLILKRGDKENNLFIEASGYTDQKTHITLNPISVDNCHDISHAIVYYVFRTRKPLILGDASKSDLFSKDMYIQEKNIRSVLCSPILHQGKLLGIIYLENNLVSEAFVGNRTKILDILATQTAISLENAMLYADMEEQVRTRTRELKEKSKDIEGILKNIDQAIVTFNKDLSLNAEHSGMASRCFPNFMSARKKGGIPDLFRLTEDKKIEFQRWTELLYQENWIKKWDKLKQLNPVKTVQYASGSRTGILELDFQPIIENDEVMKVMVLGLDITEKLSMENTLRITRKKHELQMERVMALVWQDRELVYELIYECKNKIRFYSEISDPGVWSSLKSEMSRDLHTLKGNAGSYGLNHLAGLIDDLEDFLQQSGRFSDMEQSHFSGFTTWRSMLRMVSEEIEEILVIRFMIFDRDQDYMSLPRNSYDELIKKFIHTNQISPQGASFDLINLNSFPLKDLTRKYQNIIDRFKKEHNIYIEDLKIDPENKRIHKDLFALFDVALIHIIRNSLSHGFVSEGDDSISGLPDKNNPGIISIRFSEDDGQISVFEVIDNGRGVDLDLIREKAMEKQLIGESEQISDKKLLEFIFLSGFSTRTKVDSLAGRGVGMDAVKEHLEKQGGGIRVFSQKGHGVRVKIWLPSDAHIRSHFPELYIKDAS